MLWPLLIIGLAILIYGHSLNNGFIWDDDEYVYGNPFVTSWTGLKDIWYASKTVQYYPLTFTSFWAEHKLYGGFFPASHHTLNLILHILNALLLFALLRKITPRFAGITALLFTIHPIQVETVAWITERKNLLGLFFFLLAFHAFLDSERTNKKMAYAKTFFFFIAALLSKTMSVCFAAIPLLYAWWKNGSISKRDWLRSIPFFLIAGIFGFITIYFERTYVGTEGAFSITPWERIVFAGKIFFFYLKQILFPWKFMFFYPKWDIHQTGLRDWLFPLGAAGLFLMFFLKRRSWGRGGFGLLSFYTISIFPALGFFHLYPMRFSYIADHFSYFSIPAVLLLYCSIISFFYEKSIIFLSRSHWQPSGFLKKGLLVILIIFLSVSSFRLTSNYKNPMTLWSRLLLQNPKSAAAYNNLAILLPNPDNVIRVLKIAERIEPRMSVIHLNLAKAYEKKGAYEEAVRAYQLASEGANPCDQVDYYHSIGSLYLRQNDLPNAIFWLEKATALSDHPEYQKQRNIYLQMKKFDPSGEVLLYNDLGNAYFLQDEKQKAIEIFEKAISLDSQSIESYFGLGASLMNSGEFGEAVKIFQKACTLDPKNELLKKNLAVAKKALETFKKEEKNNAL
jgi:tetratricopeptide (TPR) repeat protein